GLRVEGDALRDALDGVGGSDGGSSEFLDDQAHGAVSFAVADARGGARWTAAHREAAAVRRALGGGALGGARAGVRRGGTRRGGAGRSARRSPTERVRTELREAVPEAGAMPRRRMVPPHREAVHPLARRGSERPAAGHQPPSSLRKCLVLATVAPGCETGPLV